MWLTRICPSEATPRKRSAVATGIPKHSSPSHVTSPAATPMRTCWPGHSRHAVARMSAAARTAGDAASKAMTSPDPLLGRMPPAVHRHRVAEQARRVLGSPTTSTATIVEVAVPRSAIIDPPVARPGSSQT